LVLVLFLNAPSFVLNNAPPEKVVFRSPVSTSQKCETKIRRNQTKDPNRQVKNVLMG
jgi:hypothetical protein